MLSYVRLSAIALALASSASLLLALAAPALAFEIPNARLTPGALGPTDAARATTQEICTRGYAHRARPPYDNAWRRYRTALFREYGIPHERWSLFTVDHLVPIELGGLPFGARDGAWDLRNVWPQPKAEAKRKDVVEDALHAAVCYRRGFHGMHLSLEAAQRAIERDWTHTPVGLPERRHRAPRGPQTR